MMEVVMTTGAINHAKLQSNHHHQQTNTHFLQAGCHSCRPSNNVKALNGLVCAYIRELVRNKILAQITHWMQVMQTYCNANMSWMAS